ncbi:hypothetical protein KIN20_030397 [Parelaphostrongylus tenuis]|uniref:Uncharacterized protein n=1 Tax=Parelaphostrongylus tenuis TaxID=148309 RepID=A0AAD5WGU7_PARTN|nr:hypothetical protein KIN20_030397 [Parelaphostrongylus tenuis]
MGRSQMGNALTMEKNSSVNQWYRIKVIVTCALQALLVIGRPVHTKTTWKFTDTVQNSKCGINCNIQLPFDAKRSDEYPTIQRNATSAYERKEVKTSTPLLRIGVEKTLDTPRVSRITANETSVKQPSSKADTEKLQRLQCAVREFESLHGDHAVRNGEHAIAFPIEKGERKYRLVSL